jgi:hypothetical protein
MIEARGSVRPDDLQEAFASGQNAIELESIPEKLTPVLLRRSNSSTGGKPIDLHLEEPEGLVGLHSAFYIERPPVDARCYEKFDSLILANSTDI